MDLTTLSRALEEAGATGGTRENDGGSPLVGMLGGLLAGLSPTEVALLRDVYEHGDDSLTNRAWRTGLGRDAVHQFARKMVLLSVFSENRAHGHATYVLSDKFREPLKLAFQTVDQAAEKRAPSTPERT